MKYYLVKAVYLLFFELLAFNANQCLDTSNICEDKVYKNS